MTGEAIPIANYSVFKGWPIAGQVVSGKSSHHQITVAANEANFTVAVNIGVWMEGGAVCDRAELRAAGCGWAAALNAGMTRLQSAPGGLALDFVREQMGGKPMITRAQMTLLPKEVVDRAWTHALENAAVALLDAAVADGSAWCMRLGARSRIRAWWTGPTTSHEPGEPAEQSRGRPGPGRTGPCSCR